MTRETGHRAVVPDWAFEAEWGRVLRFVSESTHGDLVCTGTPSLVCVF